MKLPCKYGPYLLLERVSVGGMAEVYKAKEYGVEGFERTVAVKRILPHVAEDDEFIAMFKDEAKIAVQLNHGNIAQIYNLGNDQDSFYIALEYVAGRDLRAIFQRCQQATRPMPVAQACYIIMKICEGLDYAHNKKDKYNRPLSIVHRDVSPPNILVSFEGEVKLIDFGVAKAAGRASRTQAGILKGKFGYMSPEQVRGMPLDRRSDVFSVGVVLFEILCGQRLFQAETDFATLEKVRAVDVPRPSTVNPLISKPLENIIFKALTREPEQRYQSSIELHDELQAFMFAQGLFYSRKDLAAWMREHYAKEIEDEKDKQAAQADLRPEHFKPNGGGRAKSSGRPPPPPSGGRPPPPPPGRGGKPPAPPTAGAPGAKKAPKRKTMVMSTSRNLPPPPGSKAPRPKPGGRPAPAADPPTVPVNALHKPSAGLPKPKGAPRPKPGAKATANYSSTPSNDFDWDDDELETRLFEDEAEAAAAAGGKNSLPSVKRTGPGDDALSSVPTKVEINAAARPSVIPAPGVAASTDSGPDSATAKGATMVPGQMMAPLPMPAGMGMGQQQQQQPQQQQQQPQQQPQQLQQPQQHPGMPQQPGMAAPMAAQMGQQPHQPMAQGFGGAPPSSIPSGGFPGAPAMAGAGAAGGMMQQPGMQPGGMGYDYDDRPRKSNVGPIVIIVLALLVLFGAAFGGIYVMLKDRNEGNKKDANATSAPADGADGKTPAVTPGALTIQVTPSDAQVSVDGKPLSGASPFVTSVASGKHTIKITHAAHLDFEAEVDVTEAGLNFPPITLQPKAVKLSLELVPIEAKASLLSGDKVIGSGKNGDVLQVVRKPDVTYEVEVSAPGYTSRRQPVTFTGEGNQSISVTLPKGAGAAAGTPEVKPNTGGGGGGRTKRPRPKPKAKTATLRFAPKPGVPPAKVYVDGSYAGTTPMLNFKVTPGKHTVKFTWASGRAPKTQSITVGDKETLTIKAG